MAPSCPSLNALALGALLLAAAAAAAQVRSAAPPQPALQVGQQPINLDASKTEVDARTNTLLFTDVVISQAGMRVQAEHAQATGLNFANSRWTFEGKVRIDAEEHGNLRSDQATVDFKNNHIARATINGKPAEFEQKRTDTQKLACGHADQIVYDVNEGTVRLSDQAWLTDGETEISGALLVYNVRAQSMQAEHGVHIKIPQPGAAPTAAKDPKPGPGKCAPQANPPT
jgi:lipopolysaccharide transport protein LptA